MPVEGHIIDPDATGGEINRVKFLYYQDIENSIEATYDEVGVRGRSEPHPFYLETGPDIYTFDIKLVASVNESDDGSTSKIHNDYLFIKSFQYPDYGIAASGPIRPPRQAIITIGRWFNKKGIIKSPSFVFHAPYSSEGFPQSIDVRFTFRVTNTIPLDMTDIRTGFFDDPDL
jgi:hypothetical protein